MQQNRNTLQTEKVKHSNSNQINKLAMSQLTTPKFGEHIQSAGQPHKTFNFQQYSTNLNQPRSAQNKTLSNPNTSKQFQQSSQNNQGGQSIQNSTILAQQAEKRNEDNYIQMLKLFRGYYFTNDNMLKKAKENTSLLNQEVKSIQSLLSTDELLRTKVQNEENQITQKITTQKYTHLNANLLYHMEEDSKSTTPDKTLSKTNSNQQQQLGSTNVSEMERVSPQRQKEISISDKLDQILIQIQKATESAEEFMINARDQNHNLYKADELMRRNYGNIGDNYDERIKCVEVKKQYSFESSQCLYFTQIIGGNKFIVIQNRQDFKLQFIDVIAMKLVKQLYLGTNQEVRSILEWKNQLYVSAGKNMIILSLDLNNINNVQVLRMRQYKHEFIRLVTFSQTQLIAITNSGFIVILDKQSLDVVFERQISKDLLYDIIANQRLNEYTVFSHSDGLILIFITFNTQTSRFDVTTETSIQKQEPIITGVQLKDDKFLVKIGRRKNLSLYDRRSKSFTHFYIKGINEYVNEIIPVPGSIINTYPYHFCQYSYLIIRTNSSLKIIDTTTLKSHLLMNLGIYQSNLHSGLHILFNPIQQQNFNRAQSASIAQNSLSTPFNKNQSSSNFLSQKSLKEDIQINSQQNINLKSSLVEINKQTIGGNLTGIKPQNTFQSDSFLQTGLKNGSNNKVIQIIAVTNIEKDDGKKIENILHKIELDREFFTMLQ
eukprot:403373816